MEAKKIMAALQDNAELGEQAARAGFLQWMLTLPDGVSMRDEAKRALVDLPDAHLNPSALAFRECLEACTWPVTTPRRRGRRAVH